MADVSQIKVKGTKYDIKDAEARRLIQELQDRPSGGASAYLTITTTTESFKGQTVTLSKGGTTVDTTTFDTSGSCNFSVTELGTYTISCGEYSTSVSITAMYESFSAVLNDEHSIIAVTTTSDEFYGKTVTLSKNDVTVTTSTFSVLGTCSFTVMETGDYVLSCEGFTTKVTVSEFYQTYATTLNSIIVYAFHINGNESDPAAMVTYPAGSENENFTPAHMDYSSGTFNYGSWGNVFFMPKPCMLKSDGTVDYYLNENDYTKKENGTASDIANTSYDGNAMMEWGQNGTKIWYKVVPDSGSTKSATIYIASGQEDEDYVAYSFINSKNEYIDHFYTPIYNGSLISNKLRSLSGQSIMNSKTATNEVTYAKANNTGSDVEWYTEVIADRILINFLLVLMGKSMNTQAVFGEGYTTGGNQTSLAALKTGSMNTKGMFWGSNNGSATTGVKVFGMENWWGTQWRRIAGLINYPATGTMYGKMTYGTADGSTGTGYNENGSGYITLDTKAVNVSGYAPEMLFNKYGMFPAAWSSAGSATTYYCDYTYRYYSASVTTYRYAYVGGACSNGSFCGAFGCYLNYEASLSSWSIGSALSCKPV